MKIGYFSKLQLDRDEREEAKGNEKRGEGI
jgi:hypothetical protein